VLNKEKFNRQKWRQIHNYADENNPAIRSLNNVALATEDVPQCFKCYASCHFSFIQCGSRANCMPGQTKFSHVSCFEHDKQVTFLMLCERFPRHEHSTYALVVPLQPRLASACLSPNIFISHYYPGKPQSYLTHLLGFLFVSIFYCFLTVIFYVCLFYIVRVDFVINIPRLTQWFKRLIYLIFKY
jgi:hypothetical protein